MKEKFREWLMQATSFDEEEINDILSTTKEDDEIRDLFEMFVRYQKIIN